MTTSVPSWFSATICLMFGGFSVIVYGQVVLPNRGVDNRPFPLPHLLENEKAPGLTSQVPLRNWVGTPSPVTLLIANGSAVPLSMFSAIQRHEHNRLERSRPNPSLNGSFHSGA